MLVTSFLFSVSGSRNEHTDITCRVDNICALCGSKNTEGILKKKIIFEAFTNWDFLSQSDYLCVPCANILKGELSRSIRTSSFYATASRIQLFKFHDLSHMLFMKHDTPFVLCFTSSFKKHNAFRAVLNDSDERFTVRWEDRAIEINRKEHTPLFRVCVHLYYGGFTKEEISNNTFALHRCMKYGIDRFDEHYEIIKPYFRSNLLEFLCEALPSRKREVYVKITAEREKAAKAAKGASNGRETGTDKRRKGG